MNMSLRKLLNSFITSSSSSLYPLSGPKHRCSQIQRNGGLLVYFSTASPTGPLRDTLFHRLMQVPVPNGSTVPVLSQWVSEGRQVDREELRKIINQFRQYKRFAHALQISEWMNDTKYFNLAPRDTAVQLDLISKVHGLEQAEKFWNGFPNESKPIQIYGSLLNCYADAKALDKAEILMETMRKLGFAKTLSYNVMLSLYHQMGKLEKFNLLIQEMEEKGIPYDQFTNNIRLNAYLAASDIVGMEKLLMKLEADPMVTMDWNAYGVVANGYLKAGAFEKAEVVLKKFEQLIRGRSWNLGYRVLITLYARLGKKDKIYRIWHKLKSSGKFFNPSYVAVISSLVKVDDIDGAEKILVEWQEKTKFFDSRVPYPLIAAYCERGHMEKAESLISQLIEGGKEPDTTTWSRMAWGYIRNNQMEKAVDMIEKTITASYQYRKPSLPTLAQCLEYLNKRGDVDRAKKIVGLLEERGKFSVKFKNRLVRYMRKDDLASQEFDVTEQEAETLEADDIFENFGLQSNSISDYEEKIRQ